jgi:hypothetical protein
MVVISESRIKNLSASDILSARRENGKVIVHLKNSLFYNGLTYMYGVSHDGTKAELEIDRPLSLFSKKNNLIVIDGKDIDGFATKPIEITSGDKVIYEMK